MSTHVTTPRRLASALALSTAVVSMGACMNSTRIEEETRIPATDPARDMVLTRVFDASPEQVWRAWTESDQVKQWWGPTGFSCPFAQMDVRVGGASLVCMRAPQAFGGMDMYNTWTYSKIVPGRRLEFTLRFVDKDGTTLDPAAIGMPPGLPKEVPHVITVKPAPGGKAELTVAEYGYGNQQVIAMSKLGLEQCLDKMAASFTPPPEEPGHWGGTASAR